MRPTPHIEPRNYKAPFTYRCGRTLIAGIVLGAHLALGSFIAHRTIFAVRINPAVAPLTMIAIASKAAEPISTSIAVDPPQSSGIDVDPPMFDTFQVEEYVKAPVRQGGTIIPPRPSDPRMDSKSFAQQAGLAPGAEVTVVLRVEVRGDGSVGQVQVDVTGGSPQVDDAAIAYVRSLQWIGGRTGDQPDTIWIRWGVSLSG